jgi:hypothetical protein
MKKITRNIFLIALLVMLSAFSITAYAEPAEMRSEATLNYQLSVWSDFKVYISESDTEIGELISSGNVPTTIYTGTTKLKAGKNYFLHIECNRTGGYAPDFIGKFTLDGKEFKFSNGSNQLLTDLNTVKVSQTGFGKDYVTPVYRGGHDQVLTPARWITIDTADKDYKKIYFSAPIISTTPVLIAQSSNINNGVNLTWNAIDNATSYSVERSTTAGGPYTPIASDLTETSYTDKSVTANTTYYYVVKAKLSDTETVTSSEVSGTPTTETPTIESKLKVVLEPTESLQLSVDDNLAINTNMTWTSSDNTVATVNEKGVVTALAPGNTVITVKSADDTYTDYINVLVVEDASDYRLAIDLKVGQSARLTVDDLTNTVNTTWEPMDSAIANVTSKGKVTALKKGLVLFTAKDEEGNVIGKVYVRVRE